MVRVLLVEGGLERGLDGLEMASPLYSKKIKKKY